MSGLGDLLGASEAHAAAWGAVGFLAGSGLAAVIPGLGDAADVAGYLGGAGAALAALGVLPRRLGSSRRRLARSAEPLLQGCDDLFVRGVIDEDELRALRAKAGEQAVADA